MRSLVTAALAVIFAIFNFALFFAAAVAWGLANKPCTSDVIQLWGYFFHIGKTCGTAQWLPYTLLTFLALIGLVVSAGYIVRPFLGKEKKKNSSYGPLVALLLNLLLLGLVFSLGWKAPSSYNLPLVRVENVEIRHHDPYLHAHGHSTPHSYETLEMAPEGMHHAQPRSLSPSMSADTESGNTEMGYPHPQSEVEGSNDTAVEHGTMKTRAVAVSPSSTREEYDRGFTSFIDRLTQRKKSPSSAAWYVAQETERKKDVHERKQKEAAVEKLLNGRSFRETEYAQTYDRLHVDGVTGAFLHHARRGNGAAKAAIILSHLTFLFGIILALADLLLSDPDSKAKKAGGPKQPSEEIV